MKKFLSLMLCAALPLCAFAAHAENAELNIATNQYYALMERMEQFEQESGISITCEKSVDIMDTISTAYVIKNPDIDLFVFTAYDGLYTLKNMKYYAPLMVAPDKKTLKKSVKSMFFMVQTRCEVKTIKY